MKESLFENAIKYIESNRDFYNKLNHMIDVNIDGRVCHHKVEIINAIIETLEDVSNYLEIGVHNGTSMSYAVSSSKKINCYGIDLFEDSKSVDSPAHRYWLNDKINLNRTKKSISLNNSSNSDVHLIKGDSTIELTRNKLSEKLAKEKIDVLFIDGNHEYDYVKSDFHKYSDFVRDQGIIILDDYEPRYPGILKFVKEIDANRYKILGTYRGNELIIKKENK